MKITKFLLILLTLAAVTIGAVMLLGAKPNSSQSGDRINIVASANFWGDVAKQIGGDRVNVTSVITDHDTDPHLFEANADNAAALSGADIVVVNGLGFCWEPRRPISAPSSRPPKYPPRLMMPTPISGTTRPKCKWWPNASKQSSYA